jgi:hypothetical protein
MDLINRIEKDLVIIPTIKYGHKRMENGLTPESKDIILQEVKNYFKTIKWKVKKAKNNFYIARKLKTHTKIRFEIGPNPTIELYIKTTNNGWKVIGEIKKKYQVPFNIQFKTLHEMVEYTDTVQEPVIISKATLPEPFLFTGMAAMITDRYEKYITLGHQIHRCRVTNVVGLNNDGTITNDIEVVAKPGEQVWFHLDCASSSGATFDIISDGESFYPVKRYGKQRVTTEMKPKSTIDLENMTDIDKTLINLAIAFYFEENNASM